jgi:predicted Fe-S protein YdhL (DUF1289 family)
MKNEKNFFSSPCVRACRLDGEVCVGCGRTRDEIARWTRMSDNERREVNLRVATYPQNRKDE